MLNNENTIKCRKVLSLYGVVPQMIVLIEECSELIKECSDLQKAACKIIREPFNSGHSQERIDANHETFKEELVDVIVMATQAVMMAGLTEEEINQRAQKKLDKVLNKHS